MNEDDPISIDELAAGTATVLSIIFRLIENANIINREDILKILEGASAGMEPYGRFVTMVRDGLSAGEPPKLTVIRGDRED